MMDLIPWRRNKNCDVNTLQHDMNRLFDEFFSWPSFMGRLGGEGSTGFTPAVDIRESEKDYFVDAELPGIAPEEVDLSLEKGVLTIKGERKQDAQETIDGVQHRERFYGAFERRISLPEGVNQEDVEANFKNGLLTVRIGKSEQLKPRSIPVKFLK